MLPIPWSPFNMDEERGDSKNRFNPASPHNRSSLDVGLRILIQLSHCKSNVVVVKPIVKLKKPAFRKNRIDPPAANNYQSSFLRSCYLCNKNLSPDKDVYMYRGDQGFCSVECRSRQIYLVEMEEIESSTRKTLESSWRRCRPSDRRETRALLEQFRRRHKPFVL